MEETRLFQLPLDPVTSLHSLGERANSKQRTQKAAWPALATASVPRFGAPGWLAGSLTHIIVPASFCGHIIVVTIPLVTRPPSGQAKNRRGGQGEEKVGAVGR